MDDRTESRAMGQVIQIDKAQIADHLGEMDVSRKSSGHLSHELSMNLGEGV